MPTILNQPHAKRLFSNTAPTLTDLFQLFLREFYDGALF